MDYSFKNTGKNLSSVKKRLVELEKTIKQTENNIKLQKLFKDNCKRKIELLRQTSKKKTSVSALKKDEHQAIIGSIINIALSGSAAHRKKRNETIRSFKTLDQLTVALNNEG